MKTLFVIFFTFFLLFTGTGYTAPTYTEFQGVYTTGQLAAGASYYKTGYTDTTGKTVADIEYIAGNIPLIISVPHGGSLTPEEIENRSWPNNTATDAYTIELAYLIRDKFIALTGKSPHFAICRLNRVKIDLNRDSDGDWLAGSREHTAWLDYHYFLDQAKKRAITQSGTGFFIDLHGQPYQQTMIGYGLTGNQLKDSENIIEALSPKSSLKAMLDLLAPGSISFISIIKGQNSFGSMLEQACKDLGVIYAECIPSINFPVPGSIYYGGAYNLKRHTGLYTSNDKEYMTEGNVERFENFTEISGIQLECNFEARKNHRENFSEAICTSLISYFKKHLSISFPNCTDAPSVKLAKPVLMIIPSTE